MWIWNIIWHLLYIMLLVWLFLRRPGGTRSNVNPKWGQTRGSYSSCLTGSFAPWGQKWPISLNLIFNKGTNRLDNKTQYRQQISAAFASVHSKKSSGIVKIKANLVICFVCYCYCLLQCWFDKTSASSSSSLLSWARQWSRGGNSIYSRYLICNKNSVSGTTFN